MKEFDESKEFKNPPTNLKQEIAEMTKNIYPHIKIDRSDEHLEQLKKLDEWTSKILMLMESYPEALQKAGMVYESGLAKTHELGIDFIYRQIEQKILGIK
jgi:hypothetical protein